MFEKFWANLIRYYTGKVHPRGLTQNQGFETCKGRFCLYSQATALGRQRRGRVFRLVRAASPLGRGDCRRVSRLVASGARFLIARAGINLDFSNNLLDVNFISRRVMKLMVRLFLVACLS
ncbi:MAG: hypothetical protein KME23_18150 [Goleter apudmare HA4340-LM2]|jgi:hypothetical protein|nr:hypothetical protein [Goleter apudmare HA4340-LM2]